MILAVQFYEVPFITELLSILACPQTFFVFFSALFSTIEEMRNNQALYLKDFSLRKIKYAWASQFHKDGKALSFVLLCKLQLTWHTPPGDDKRFDLHDASFILKSLTWYCVFSHDVMAAVFVSQTSPVGVELFSYVNAFFCSNKFA